MKKTKVVAGLTAFVLGSMSILPAKAVGTDVTVGITKTEPSVISVTVPTTVPIAVVKDAVTTKAPKVMVGSTTTTSGGYADVTAGEGSASLKFQNTGNTKVSIATAIVTNSTTTTGKGWSISPTATNAYEMTLGFDGLVPTSKIAPGMNGTLTGTAIEIDKANARSVKMVATVGGTSADYTDATDAKAFSITWDIAAI